MMKSSALLASNVKAFPLLVTTTQLGIPILKCLQTSCLHEAKQTLEKNNGHVKKKHMNNPKPAVNTAHTDRYI